MRYKINNSTLTTMANVIRHCTGKEETMLPSEMANEISAIQISGMDTIADNVEIDTENDTISTIKDDTLMDIGDAVREKLDDEILRTPNEMINALSNIQPEKTVSGNPITVTDALSEPAVSLKVFLEPKQDGTPWIDEPTTEPYLMRAITKGTKEDYSLVGGTVAWNQLVQNGNFASTSNWNTYQTNSFTVSDNVASVGMQATNASFIYQKINSSIIGHKYLLMASVKSSNIANVIFYWDARVLNSFDISSNWTNIAQIINNVNGGVNFSIRQYGNSLVVGTLDIKNCIIIDLTQMFGSTIADYAYSLETTEAGSGIAWLKSYGFFTEEYYAYNAGELISAKTSAKKVVGFNLFDKSKVTNDVALNTTGGTFSVSGWSVSDYIPVFPNTNYYLKDVATGSYRVSICFYDANKNFTKYLNVTGTNRNTSGVKQTDADTMYMRITVPSEFVDTCNVNIHLDGERDGEYEPYEGHTYAIDNIDLRGLFKLSNGKLYCDGDAYKPDGTVTRRYGIVDLGELNWSRSTTGVEGQYRFTSSGIASAVKIVASNISANIITAKYVTVKGDTGWATEIDKAVWIDHLGAINIIDKSYTDKDAFKAAMSGVYLVYELATPTTETATAYTSPIPIEAGATEEFVDNRTVPIPVGNSTVISQAYPIIGWDEVRLTRRGVNLANFVQDKGISTDGIVVNQTGRIATVEPIIIRNGVDYVFRHFSEMNISGIIAVYNGDTLVRRTAGIKKGDQLNVSGGDRFYFCVYYGSEEVTINYAKAMIVESTDTVTSYEPYQTPTVYTVSLTQAGTVYGGTVDVVSGELVVDRAEIASYNGETLPGKWISDRDVYAEGTTPTIGAQVVYELAAPLTYQLTPTEVQMLLGYNTLTADAEMELTYKGQSYKNITIENE